MPGTTIRIDERTLASLRELASRQNMSMQAFLAQAMDSIRRDKFLEQANAAFAALREDPEARAEEQREREICDRTLADGLDGQ